MREAANKLTFRVAVKAIDRDPEAIETSLRSSPGVNTIHFKARKRNGKTQGSARLEEGGGHPGPERRLPDSKAYNPGRRRLGEREKSSPRQGAKARRTQRRRAKAQIRKTQML